MQHIGVVQFGALGILGFLVIGGFVLFRWGVQKWLPSLVTTIKEGMERLANSLDGLCDKTTEVRDSLDVHENNTRRFDGKVKEIVSKLDNIAMIQNDHTTAIERLITIQETLIKSVTLPKEIVERQTIAFEKLADQLGDMNEKSSN